MESLSAAWNRLLEALAPRDANLRRTLERSVSAPSSTFEVALDCRFHAARVDPSGSLALAEADLEALDPADLHSREACGTKLITAVAHARTSRLADALVRLAECEVDARALGDNQLRLRVLTELARAHAIRGEAQPALGKMQEAIALARSRGDTQAEAENLLTLGFFFGERDEPEPYIRHTEAALVLFDALDEPMGRAMCHCNIAGGLSRLERFDEARSHYERSRAIATGHGLEYTLALCLAGEGGILCRTGELDLGRDLYQQSNAILERLGRTFQVVRHHHLLGQYYLLGGRIAEARTYLETAIASARQHTFRGTLVQSLELASQAAEGEGDLTTALRHLRERAEVQRVDYEESLATKVEMLNQRHQLETAQREADLGRKSNEQLRRLNLQLTKSLARQQELQEELLHLSQTDPLTGLSNRRHLRELLELELTRITRHFRPLTVLLLDIDRFKAINDQYGHTAGDAVLVEFSRRLRDVIRASDAVARWGGEEFCVALFDTDLEASLRPAEAILEAMRRTPFATRSGSIAVTVSIGVATLSLDRFDVDALVGEADAALYLAKARGRDRIAHAAERAAIRRH